MILEKDIEKAFLKEAKKRGHRAIKFKDPSRRGAPDRIVLGKDRLIFFVEFKAPSKKPKPHQYKYHEMLESFGFEVLICDNMELKMINSRVMRQR